MTDYVVHSRHDTLVDVPAKTKDGVDILGKMPAAIIELVPADGAGPSLTLHRHAPTAEAMKAVLALFAVGNVVRDAEFTLVAAAKAKEAA